MTPTHPTHPPSHPPTDNQPTSEVVFLEDCVGPQHRPRALADQRCVGVQLSAVKLLLGLICSTQ